MTIPPEARISFLFWNGKALDPSDYVIVSYSDSVNKGNGKLVIRGVGNYGGEKSANFVIYQRSISKPSEIGKNSILMK